MTTTYLRILFLSVLLVVLMVLLNLRDFAGAYTAPCIQDCEDSQFRCEDSCAPLCNDTNDDECGNCIHNCQSQFQSCMKHAIYCEGSSNSYTPECQVDFTPHCPIVNGVADCRDSRAHYGYTLTCNRIGGPCVACPDHNWHCVGSNGYPPCY